MLFTTITDLAANQDVIRRRAYGVIETRQGQFVSLKFKPWPKLISATEAAWTTALPNSRTVIDRCRVYFNQPVGHKSYLALKFIESTLGTTMATLRCAMVALDEVARIKRSDAILAHVTNERISDRLMRRWGWESHLAGKRGRHFIKRFYGIYPPTSINLGAQTMSNATAFDINCE
ncbi:MAG TPA: hypothetical protein PKD64_16340 [Pirellulaceae bacterium]|nr:hypothetical protein [Pirellulaceae bacterium]HMO93759.1 hypothetical protein [Pirellulaceae bacterium]HMP71472.1 hypothetical protein [Pirellulaceae bacterium]